MHQLQLAVSLSVVCVSCVANAVSSGLCPQGPSKAHPSHVRCGNRACLETVIPSNHVDGCVLTVSRVCMCCSSVLPAPQQPLTTCCCSHKMMINNYVHFYGKPDLKVRVNGGRPFHAGANVRVRVFLQAYVEKVQNAKTDMDVLRDNHRFLWDASDDDPSTLSADDRFECSLFSWLCPCVSDA